MSRRKNKPSRRVKVPIEKLNAIVERTRTEALPEAEHATLKAAVDTLARLSEKLETKTTTLERVRHPVFGPRTETADKVLGKDSADTKGPGATNPSIGRDRWECTPQAAAYGSRPQWRRGLSPGPAHCAPSRHPPARRSLPATRVYRAGLRSA